MPGTAVIVILVMALLGVLPRWSHSRNWAMPFRRSSTDAGYRSRPARPHLGRVDSMTRMIECQLHVCHCASQARAFFAFKLAIDSN